MEMIALPMSVLAAIAMPAPITAPALGISTSAQVATAQPGSARRSSGGAHGIVKVSARIIRGSARVGAGFGPPLPDMAPRPTTVTAADGSLADALIYDFE